MYVWQWCFGDKYCVVGRTWDEFLHLCERLKPYMKKQHLVVYVHNLSYEFTFLKGIYPFKPEEVFCMDARKILKCEMFGYLEFRCSYLHSNMSLAEFTKKMGAEHSKLSGEEFDYNKERYPWTPLTEKEIAYCTYDVIGLVEALTIEMQHDHDNLYTVPSTSTGYVRRDAKKAMRHVPAGYTQKQMPNYHIYSMCREAFRGGNTHASRFFAGHVLHNVSSADRSSSYPDVLVNHLYPVDEFWECGPVDFDLLIDLLYKRKRAMLIRCHIWNLRLKDDTWGCPYISRDKCRKIAAGVFDNGRVISADFLETTITDVDLKILLDEYEWDGFEAYDVAYTRYGKLPPAFINTINHYYDLKTILKGKPEEELSYFRAKQKLNSLYGMCAQDPVKETIEYINDDFVTKTDDPEKLLEQHNKYAFLCYQWGVWVTAWARWELEQGLKLAGDNFVYCDTDSVKYLHNINWEDYNNARIKNSKRNGSFAVDSKGREHYMGVFEFEGCYKSFVTLGAKKYAYEDESGLHITVAGVIKKKGAQELAKKGGIEAFKPSFIFTEAGGVEAVYNDSPEVTEYQTEGHTVSITSNVVLRESTYTLGITEEYERILSIAQHNIY